MRWGIIGVGDVTERKSGPGFQQAERSELVAVMRRNSELAADYARRNNVPRWYDDADELISDPEVDAVYVATPPDSHREFAVRVARAGKPVYVEKPMARTAPECEDMIAACDEAGWVCSWPTTVAPCRALSRSRNCWTVAGSVGSGRSAFVTSGPPRWVSLTRRAGGSIPRSRVVAISSTSALTSSTWTGSWSSDHSAGVAANRGGRYLAEDLVTGVFSFRSGVEGVGVWNYDSFQYKDHIEVIGTAGALSFSCFADEPLRLLTAGGVEQIETPSPETVQLPLIQTVVNALTGHGESPSDGHTALRTARVIDGLLSDHRDRHGITY